jgi:pilus assembly protein CpaB
MNVRTIVFVAAALLIAGGTAFVARGLLTSKPASVAQDAPKVESKKVLVAKANLPAGTIIREEDLEWQKWPEDGINSAYLIEGESDMTTIVGAVVRRGIAAGGPVTDAMVARPGDRGFLAAILRPGMRAITIDVEENTSVAGLLFPGDRVDLLLLQLLPELKGPNGEEIAGPLSFEPRTAETVLEDIRVLAIDRTVNDIEGTEPQKLNSVTLELTPKQAEMVASVRDLGDLSLSLRGLAKDKQPSGSPVADAGNLQPVASAFLSAPVSPQGTAPADVTTVAAATTTESNGDTALENEMEDPFLDKSIPERGDSATYDYEVSRTLEDRMLKTLGDGSQRVDVIRGSSQGDAETLTITLPLR